MAWHFNSYLYVSLPEGIPPIYKNTSSRCNCIFSTCILVTHWIPSGKRLQNYPWLTGKLAVSMAIFNSKLLVITRGYQVSLRYSITNDLHGCCILLGEDPYLHNGFSQKSPYFCILLPVHHRGPYRTRQQVVMHEKQSKPLSQAMIFFC